MAKTQKNTAALVRELLEPTVNALGYALWDLEFVKEGTEWYLRITIDSPDGIGIDDCEKVSRAIDPVLDEADPIEQSYRLEVSSPGVERVLRTPEHLAACRGERVCAKLFRPITPGGAKQIVGTLGDYDGAKDSISILPDGEEEALTLPCESISRLTTVFDFD